MNFLFHSVWAKTNDWAHKLFRKMSTEVTETWSPGRVLHESRPLMAILKNPYFTTVCASNRWKPRKREHLLFNHSGFQRYTLHVCRGVDAEQSPWLVLILIAFVKYFETDF